MIIRAWCLVPRCLNHRQQEKCCMVAGSDVVWISSLWEGSGNNGEEGVLNGSSSIPKSSEYDEIDSRRLSELNDEVDFFLLPELDEDKDSNRLRLSGLKAEEDWWRLRKFAFSFEKLRFSIGNCNFPLKNQQFPLEVDIFRWRTHNFHWKLASSFEKFTVSIEH